MVERSISEDAKKVISAAEGNDTAKRFMAAGSSAIKDVPVKYVKALLADNSDSVVGMLLRNNAALAKLSGEDIADTISIRIKNPISGDNERVLLVFARNEEVVRTVYRSNPEVIRALLEKRNEQVNGLILDAIGEVRGTEDSWGRKH